jgi:eukaryotic-like serine/threonine-protein kinase
MTSPIAVGSIIAETYKITSQLGVGGMGSVWTADHLRLPGKQVAVKVLHAALASGEILLRFRREAEIASRIGHPNIVEMLDFNTLPGGEPFLVMELLTGESLAARLRRGRLSEKAALDIARQIGSALFAAHQMNVVHRDLKPDNIFLCPRDVDGELRDHVKVLDFGISKIRNSQTVVTQDAAIMGTPYYMSPEQATGKNQEIDGRTDIFALGAIVFEMLSGTTAFPGEGLPQVIYRVVFEPHPSLAHIVPSTNPRILAAVDRALAKKAGDRFADMAAFVEALTGRPLMTATGLRAIAAPPTGAATDPTVPPAAAATSSAALSATSAAPAGQHVLPASSAALAASSLAPAGPGTLAEPVMGKGRRGLWIALVGVAAIAAAVAAVVLRPQRPSHSRPSVKETATVVKPVNARKEPSVTVDAGQPAAAQTVPAQADEKRPPRTQRNKSTSREEALPASVAAELDVAESALAARNLAEAIRNARHSLYEKKTARASSILTRAYCLQGDLGAAKAELSHVAASDRARVIKACRSAGLDL